MGVGVMRGWGPCIRGGAPYKHHRVVRTWEEELVRHSRLRNHNIPQLEWGDRRCCTGLAAVPPRNNADAPSGGAVSRNRHNRNLCFRDGLVARRGHLLGRRQVDPQLAHLQHPAVLAEGCRVKFFVDNPTKCKAPKAPRQSDRRGALGQLTCDLTVGQSRCGVDNRSGQMRVSPTAAANQHQIQRADNRMLTKWIHRMLTKWIHRMLTKWFQRADQPDQGSDYLVIQAPTSHMH
jgi:hypothetical protein